MIIYMYIHIWLRVVYGTYFNVREYILENPFSNMFEICYNYIGLIFKATS